MKINNVENVNQITFKHKSSDFKFRCYTDVNRQENNEGVIEFADLREVDSLIMMLEKFRMQCYGRLGEWH